MSQAQYQSEDEWQINEHGNLTRFSDSAGALVTIFETNTGFFKYVCDGNFSCSFETQNECMEDAENEWF